MLISIIIPVLNEASCLIETLATLKRFQRDYAENLEVIVVDGGSTDGTVAAACEHKVMLLRSEPGRAIQMNCGAAEAKGDVLLFLHADTQLPENASAVIQQTLADGQIDGGCFRLQFDHRHPVLSLSAFMSRFSFRLFHYGDAAYFVRRKVFHLLGGYRSLPIMEDVDFWIRLSKGHRTVVLKENVTTSARKFLKHGVFRQQVLAIVLVSLFLFGVDSSRLARIYSHSRKQ